MGPHEAYKKRMKEGKGPAAAQQPSDRVRIGAVALGKDIPPGKLGPMLRNVLTQGNIDILLALGVTRDTSETISEAASAVGYGTMEGQNGLWALARCRLAAQEGDLTGYPFDGFYALLPGQKPLWALAGDTALVKEDRVGSIFDTLKRRAESHYAMPVVVALGFRSASEDVNAAAREALAAGNLKPVGAAEGGIQFLAPASLLGKLEPVAEAPGGPEAAGALGLAMVDLWIKPKPSP